jgi:hypothetical protein
MSERPSSLRGEGSFVPPFSGFWNFPRASESILSNPHLIDSSIPWPVGNLLPSGTSGTPLPPLPGTPGRSFVCRQNHCLSSAAPAVSPGGPRRASIRGPPPRRRKAVCPWQPSALGGGAAPAGRERPRARRPAFLICTRAPASTAGRGGRRSAGPPPSRRKASRPPPR